MIFSLGESITNLNRAMIVKTYNVASESLFGLHAITGHKGNRVRNAHILT